MRITEIKLHENGTVTYRYEDGLSVWCSSVNQLEASVLSQFPPDLAAKADKLLTDPYLAYVNGENMRRNSN